MDSGAKKERSRSKISSAKNRKHQRRHSDDETGSDSASDYESSDSAPRKNTKSSHKHKHTKSTKSRHLKASKRDRSHSRERSEDESMQEKQRQMKRDRSHSRERSEDESMQEKQRQMKRDRSHSRERSDGEDEAMEEKQRQMKEETRRQKDQMKATETTGEKRARRLAKKALKEQKRKEKMGWDQEYMEYSNQDNPFGDENLLTPFMWKKKMDKEGTRDLMEEEQQKNRKKKMFDNRIELEKVKKRRLERERELLDREKQKEMEQRDKEAEYHRVWERQEDNFHLNQAKLRSQIRIKDGRAKPIDLLGKYISAEDDELAIEMHEPYTYLYGLTVMDLEDLLEDIKVYLELEKGKNVDYWRDIIIVTEDELNKLRKIDPTSKDLVGDRRDGINNAVSSDVSAVFRGKSTNQLRILEHQILARLRGGEGIDVGYWESLLRQLKSHVARTRLRERHQEVLRMKLFKLKQEQGIQPSGPIFPIAPEEESPSPQPGPSQEAADEKPPSPSASQEGETTTGEAEEKDLNDGLVMVEEEGDDIDATSIMEYITGSYSPLLISTDDLEIDTVVYDIEDDTKKLEFARQQVLSTGKVRLDEEGYFVKKAKEGMNDDEVQFSVEVPVTAQAFLWSDKYRPRKPRFFNRVHTGFEWNKYNQTHYDVDNPPPKIVQGYKFNIFYPDLIDRTVPPEYTLTAVQNEPDFSTLRFKAGPPYEDIAFKVVNREWESSWKRGFRCQFQNNIFQLWFHFKRYRYRR